MKSASPALIALMDSTQFVMADLFTITLPSGETLRWTSSDLSIVWAGATYIPVPIERSEIRLVMGIEVSTLSATVFPTADMTAGGNPFLIACKVGALDGATLLLQRGYFSSFAAPCVGVLHLFEGTISVESANGIEANLSVRDYLSLFNIDMPRNSHSPGCNNTLYDAGCGINRASRAFFGTVQAGSTKQVINHSLAQTAGYFNYGVIEFLTGINAGVTVTVSKHLLGTLGLAIPLKSTPAVGDTFNVYPGCDRTLNTCKNKYDNVIKFRGQPWIPKPETAY
jgi:uncharacterized phage protein (TIGR02218 family)